MVIAMISFAKFLSGDEAKWGDGIESEWTKLFPTELRVFMTVVGFLLAH